MSGKKNSSEDKNRQNFGPTLKRLLAYFKPYRKKVVFLMICAVISVIFAIMGPRILGTATNLIVLQSDINQNLVIDLNGLKDSNAVEKLHQYVNEDGYYIGPPISDKLMQYLKLTLGVLLIVYGVSALFSYIQQRTTARVAQKTIYDLREDVSKKIQKLPLNYYDTHTHGEILSRTTTDIEQISTTIQQMLSQLITSFLTIVGIMFMMFTINWQIALIAVCVLPAALFLCGLIMRRSQKYYLGQQDDLGTVNSYVEEYYAGHNVVKLYRTEERTEKNFDIMSDRLNENARHAQFASSTMMPVTNMVGNIGYVGVCILGGIMTLNGTLTIGAIQAFIQYMQQFTQPIVQTTNVINMLQATIAASGRIFELLDEDEQSPEKTDLVHLDRVEGNIAFEHVKFGYSPDKILVTDMNIDVKSGQKVGICGPTGAGKTTMINLLMRFYDLNGGAIKIDGIDTTDMSRQDVRSKFGMVLQDTWLYSASIKDNVRYGKPEATDEEVIDACKMANAHAFITAMPDGYDTMLDEAAENLSSGQKQLLTIARAFCANPQILILDEATSSVDTRTEKLMVDAMKKLTQGRTNFQIAHRLSTIFDSDLILVLKDGDLVEQGSHDQLMEMGGVYADLYNSQFA
jgi:ATP-binding cassette subfamily B protein